MTYRFYHRPIIVSVCFVLLMLCHPLFGFSQTTCASAVSLGTPSTTCTTTTGNLENAVNSLPAGSCGGATNTTTRAVWFRFTANATNPIINASLYAGSSYFTDNVVFVELLQGTCPTSFTSLGCHDISTPLQASGLTIGVQYYVRVYVTGTTSTTSGTYTTRRRVNVCVQNPPANDDCSDATVLTPDIACNSQPGILNDATDYTANTATSCATKNDVWFQFTATSTTHSITATGMSSLAMQVLKGTCSSMTDVSGCGQTSPALLTGLTIGTTYFIRVYSTSNTTGTFNICVQEAPANDLCGNATPITTSTTCTSYPVDLNASTTNTSTTGVCTTDDDVWYTFTASSPGINLTIPGAPSNTKMQVLTGSCSSFTAVSSCGIGNNSNVTGLIVGTTYYIRVYNTSNASGSFNLCVKDNVLSNDDCSGAILLSSNTSCINTSASFYPSTASTNTLGSCSGPVVYDIWYKFVAQAIDEDINLSSLGSGISGIGLQLVTACSSPVVLACGTTSINGTNLTVGTTYWVRVYASTGSSVTTAAAGAFDICITHQSPIPPPNDECTGAVNLPNNATCTNTNGNIAGATASAVATNCALPIAYDVWYKFTATGANSTITINNTANNFTNRNLELFSGSCGSLTSIACGTTSIAATGLTVGSTYYIRVFSTTGPAPTGHAYFTICVATAGMPIRFGNSYVNITKKTTGGVIEPGDELEIRMTVNHTSGTFYAMRYVDSLPTHTDIVAGSDIRVISNEGVTIKSYTQAGADDAAMYVANPTAGNYQIRMNLAFGSSSPGTPVNTSATEAASATGQMAAGSDIPRGGGGMLFATSFRVKVTGVVGDVITLGRGKFVYRTTAGGSDITVTATPYQLLISQPMSLCQNSTGVNMSQESGGTFGDGTTLNRTYDLANPIPGYSFVNSSVMQALGDGQYSIVKNISPRNGTNRNADRYGNCVAAIPSQDACANRMHGGHWDIDGDHSGTNNSIGNVPPADGVSGGYMLMVNADFVASETYRQTIGGLCPNTYYEFSAWFRNICPTCGVDYTTGSNYSTPAPGVLPNLTFALDDFDRYNTGEITYGSGWVKKGFVFVTGPSQSSATFSIRNNSQGGGGNDWVMDDISVATCLPNMKYSPSLNPTVCESNALTIYDTISSYFNNYRYHLWQKSSDNGTSWSNISTVRDSTPVFDAGTNSWQYITSYTIPPTSTAASDSGDLYRVIVATSAGNVGNTSCQVTDGISIINLKVINCAPVLNTDFLSFNAILADDRTNLNWTTSKEDKRVHYVVERSIDGINFSTAGNIDGRNDATREINAYAFSDMERVTNKIYYRVVMIDQDQKKKYSRVIMLTLRSGANLEFVNVINPFNTALEFDFTSTVDTKAEAEILDMFGKVVKKATYLVHKGVNSLSIFDTGFLPNGAYVFRITSNGQRISKKILKKRDL